MVGDEDLSHDEVMRMEPTSVGLEPSQEKPQSTHNSVPCEDMEDTICRPGQVLLGAGACSDRERSLVSWHFKPFGPSLLSTPSVPQFTTP